MKKFECSADMGSAKIVGTDFNVCFSNGVGDGSFTVFIDKKPKAKKIYDKDGVGWRYAPDHQVEFVGHFTVKEAGKVKLAVYDCGHETYDFCFPTGRWFVENYRGDVYINKQDDELHA